MKNPEKYNQPKLVKLAGGIILDQDSRVLLIHRNTEGLKQWEIPGGKVEEWESGFEAAERELYEELGLEIDVRKRLGDKAFFQNGVNMHYIWYLASIKSGSLKILEPETFDDIRYFSAEDMRSNFDLLSPNVQNFLGMVESNQISLEQA